MTPAETPLSLARLRRSLARFFFGARDPDTLVVVAALRIGFGILLLVNMAIVAPDVTMFFGARGVLPAPVGHHLFGPGSVDVLDFLAPSDRSLRLCYAVFLGQIVMLIVGLGARFSTLSVFLWLIAFHSRNPLIFDGEDTLLRLYGFFLIFLPTGARLSLDARLARRRPGPAPPAPPALWPLRLFQIEITLVYLSTAWEKMRGQDWANGTALYYVVHLDDLFGRFPVPAALFESPTLVKAMTWGVLLVEITLPFTLWFRETRRPAIVVGILFHLAIDYAMFMLLFQWVMILGLLSFTTPQDYRALAAAARRVGRRSPSRSTAGCDLRFDPGPWP